MQQKVFNKLNPGVKGAKTWLYITNRTAKNCNKVGDIRTEIQGDLIPIIHYQTEKYHTHLSCKHLQGGSLNLYIVTWKLAVLLVFHEISV